MHITFILISTMCSVSGNHPATGSITLLKKAPLAIGKCKLTKTTSFKGIKCEWYLSKEKKKPAGTTTYTPLTSKGNSLIFQSTNGTELLQLTPTKFSVSGVYPTFNPTLIKHIQCNGRAIYNMKKKEKKEKI